MHTILVFGFRKNSAQIRKSFSSPSAKILYVNTLSEFKATALSRIFDLWIIDCKPHKDGAEGLLLEMIRSRQKPFIFLVGANGPDWQTAAEENPKVVLIGEQVPIASWAQAFYEIDTDNSSENKLRYIAGYLEAKPGIETMVTNSPLMLQLLELVKDIAPTESALLIYGETGTGKELLATILHNESRRKNGPFMAVNCGALPDTLLESELFGYEKGAFTGANISRIGKLEHATGGTLFLDEIEAMSEAMQVRLLRVLQEKSLQRLGSNVEIKTDFRLMAATNADPGALLASDFFRNDLYYRIAVFPIHIPPLRQRKEDIPLLASHFVNRKKRDGRDYVQGLDSHAMKKLLRAPWSGNIRELQNIIERAVMLADKKMISADLIDIAELSARDGPDTKDSAFSPGTTLKEYKTNKAAAAERLYLEELLHHTRGRINEAARLAGLTPRALFSKMKAYGLKKEYYKLPC